MLGFDCNKYPMQQGISLQQGISQSAIATTRYFAIGNRRSKRNAIASSISDY
jgi:hypothetical protein